MRTRRLQSSSDLVTSKRRSVSPNSRQDGHQSVLLHEAVEYLAIKPADTVVDATLGGAGHARALTALLSTEGTFVGFDLDHDAIDRAKEALAGSKPRVCLVESNFRDLEDELRQRNISHIDKALFDLGWSAFQLDAGRGFSFLSDEPLTMTYSKEFGDPHLTARKIINEWEESSLADIFFGWGEERYSRRIAKAIVERRSEKPFTTSRELAEFIKASVPLAYARGRIHPATRTFQALRIAVNDELGALTEGLAAAWKLLCSGGRIAVITFHSIEDRKVKRQFQEWEKSGLGIRVTRKPLLASDQELQANPRARSAKLRVFQKI